MLASCSTTICCGQSEPRERLLKMKPTDKFWPFAYNPEKAIELVKNDLSVVKDQVCFFCAARECSTAVLEEFINQGADVNQKDRNDFTALSNACSGNNKSNVEVLLRSGADPNDKSALWCLVDDGVNGATNARLDILREFISAGADINMGLAAFDGYNLYARAMDCEDTKVIKILDANGGRLSDIVLNAPDSPPLNLETLRSRLVKALKKAWTEVKRDRKGEKFYLFGLETDTDCVVLTPICNTEEQVELEHGSCLEDSPELKYCITPDHKLYGAGKDHLDAIEFEINGRDTTKSRVTNKLLKIFEGALADLDAKKFFGSGKNRDRVLLTIAKIDYDDKEKKELDRIIKRLNPSVSFQRYKSSQSK